MNFNYGPADARLGHAGQRRGLSLWALYRDMALAEAWAPRRHGSVCALWWMEEMRRRALGRAAGVCGDEAVEIPEYYAWLSEEEIRALDELDERARGLEAREAGGSEGETSASGGGAGSSGQSEATDEREREREREERWMERDRIVDALAEVVKAGVDHARGVSPEERARRSTEFYADSDGSPALMTDYSLGWPWQAASVDIVMGPGTS
ncbi:hypothetical protein C8Q79DRAFT_635810 [Trametes meyenii]|nr:hypothetical protein C8Q79DRAFT_635810 [Trametes meyenii]